MKKVSPMDLEEISKYKNPPERVKKCMEAVFLVLTNKILEWKEIKKEM